MATAKVQSSVHRRILFHSILTFFLNQSILVSACASNCSGTQDLCIKTGINLSGGDNDRFGLAITYRCMQVKDDTFSFRTGEYNMETGATRCDKEPVFKYRTNSRTKRSIRGAVTECNEGVCVSVFSRKIITKKNKVSTYVSLSALYTAESELDENREETFFNTEVFFDVKGQLKTIARGALTIYLESITDELDFRRRIFLGAKNGTCEFAPVHICQRADARCFYY